MCDASVAPGRRHPLLPPARAGPASEEEGEVGATPTAAPYGEGAAGFCVHVCAGRGIPAAACPPAPGFPPCIALVTSQEARPARKHARDSAGGVASLRSGNPRAGGTDSLPPPPRGPQPGPAQGPGDGPAAQPRPTPGACSSQRPWQPVFWMPASRLPIPGSGGWARRGWTLSSSTVAHGTNAWHRASLQAAPHAALRRHCIFPQQWTSTATGTGRLAISSWPAYGPLESSATPP